jgi:hypothetical protein
MQKQNLKMSRKLSYRNFLPNDFIPGGKQDIPFGGGEFERYFSGRVKPLVFYHHTAKFSWQILSWLTFQSFYLTLVETSKIK